MTKSNFSPAISDSKVSCPVCGSNKSSVLFQANDFEYKLPGLFYVSTCDECGLIFQNPRPKFSEILRYYTDTYEPFKKVGSPLMQNIRHRFLVVPRINKYSDLFKNYKGKAKLLDVGCASGDLLSELSNNSKFICEGVEPVNYAVKLARERGLKVQHSTVENLKCKKNTYDLIIMNHVLEHLQNPQEVVKKIYQILKKGGYFSGELPCADSIERIIFGKYWAVYHLPRHLTFFTKKLLKRFLEEKGFVDIEIHLQPMPSAWQGSVRNFSNFMNLPKVISKSFSGHSVFLNVLSFPFSYLCSKLGYSSIMHFTARK